MRLVHRYPSRLNSLRRIFVCVALLAFVIQPVIAAGRSRSARGPKIKPNVLFIISDDLNTSLGCYGHPLVKTPHIDRLATRGVRFDLAYCQAPVCNPTRASCFSGLLPETIGVLDNKTSWPDRLENSQYMPRYFREQGYFTGTIGKVLDHGRVPKQPFWDLEIPEWGKHPESSQIVEQGGVPSEISTYWAPLNVEDEATGDGDVARRATVALEQLSGKQQPFFLAVGFRRPHAPYAAPSRYFDQYPLESIALPQEPPGHLKSILPAAKNGLIYNSARAIQTLRAYYACISFMDAQVGILLEMMDQLGLWENTIVVFVSDHGYHTGHHGMWHKQTLFEQGARVPLIVAAPGKRGNVACRRLVEILDLYPTLTDYCGLETPEALEGTSLVPLLEDPQRPWKPAAVTIEGRIVKATGKRTVTGHSVRTERYRYTEWDGGQQGIELYDHATDPQEFVNLAQQSTHTETVSRLKTLLRTRLPNVR